MPELPEVETIIRGLKPRILNQTLRRIHIIGSPTFRSQVPSFLKRLHHFHIEGIMRHGKGLYWSLAKRQNPKEVVILKIKLGMTGQFQWKKKTAPLENHTHVIFEFMAGDHELRYRDVRRFGHFELWPKGKSPTEAPDALRAGKSDMVKALRRKKGMVKHALLNQHVLAGLGNIYVDESLYLAKIHPKEKLERLSNRRLELLCLIIKRILQKSIGRGGTTFKNYVDINGKRGGFKASLLVYGRENERCFCGALIRRIVVAGRGTHICPSCQRIK